MIDHKIMSIESILKSHERVFKSVEKTNLININYVALDEAVDRINNSEVRNWESSLKGIDEEDALGYLLLRDALSFCFWPNRDWTFKGKTGTKGISAAIKDAYDRGIPVLDFSQMATISYKDFRDVFGMGTPLEDFRISVVKDLGTGISNNFEGKVDNVIGDTAYDTLCNLYLGFENFQKDVAIHRDGKDVIPVHFYKRALLFIHDAGRYLANKGQEIENLDQLPALCDYRIPQVMVHDGILEYSPELSRKIEEKFVFDGSGLQINSPSCAIRSAMSVAIMHIADRTGWTMMDVDNYFYLRSKELEMVNEHHREFTFAY